MRDIPFDPTGMEWWTFGVEDPKVHAHADRLRAVVDGLPLVQRAVINAVFYERLQKREVARQLGMYPLQVDRTLERALRTIQKAMRDAAL